LQVRVAGDKLIIHGRHEKRADATGMEIAREVRRSYTLPSDIDPKTLKSDLNSHGVLTVSAAKKK
jgi:HSP20 family molecular chaperone IbpA